MPEAAVHKDNCMKPAEYDVGLAGQILPVDPEAKTLPVKATPNEKFRLRVPSPDSRHVTASRRGIMDVRHTPGQPPHRSGLLPGLYADA